MTKETCKQCPEHERLTDDIPTYLHLNPPTLTSNISSKAPASGLSRSISRESNNHKDNTEHFTLEPPPESAPSASRYVTLILDKVSSSRSSGMTFARLFLYFAKSNSSFTLVDLIFLLILSIHVTLILSHPYIFTIFLLCSLSFHQMCWLLL